MDAVTPLTTVAPTASRRSSQADGDRLPNLVFVMNYRFLPRAFDDAYLYGVVQHVARAGLVSEANGARVGLILYDRDPIAQEPEIDEGTALGRWPFVRIRYHDGDVSLKGPIEQAIDAVHRRWRIDPGDEPFVLYFQTGSLLRHAPDDCRVIVTHHSPFVRNVAEVLGWEAARHAFDWDHAKTDHLERTQADGVAYIGANPSVRCAEISIVQRAYLLGAGVAERQVMALSPPVGSDPLPPLVGSDRMASDPVASHPSDPGLNRQPSGGHAGIESFVRRAQVAGRPPLALLAVSRFDHFKNAELFLEATAIAIRRGHVSEALVIGGHDGDPLTEELKASASADLAGRITFFGRLPRSVLIHGVFVPLRASGSSSAAPASIWCRTQHSKRPERVFRSSHRTPRPWACRSTCHRPTASIPRPPGSLRSSVSSARIRVCGQRSTGTQRGSPPARVTSTSRPGCGRSAIPRTVRGGRDDDATARRGSRPRAARPSLAGL